MLYDRARIHVEGGRGGDGCVSFRREAHVPRGGPDGGDGGRGGQVLIVCDPSRADLAELRGRRHFRAERGRHGEGKNRHGARGEDVVIGVPPGTELISLSGDRSELLSEGQRVVAARGGRGGHGNKRFAGATRQAPRFAERGGGGDSGWIELRLKLLADVGLVGLPNAGKSSLLARLTRAQPKIAAYPFTTLEPVLGVIDDEERALILADIPGLIEGAAEGAGLGHEFLAHAERCAMLVHLIELTPAGEASFEAYETVRGELRSYGAGLDRLPELVVLSKSDLLASDELEGELSRWKDRLEAALGPLPVSALSRSGMPELRSEILRATSAAERRGPDSQEPEPEFEAEHRVYRPEDEDGYWVEREGGGTFRVHGRGVGLLVERHDLANAEALAYLEQRFAEMGVIAALRAAGFKAGDEVRIGEQEFELHPAS